MPELASLTWLPSLVSLLFGNMSSRPILFWIILLGALFLASVVLNAQIWLLGYWASRYSEEPAARVSVALWVLSRVPVIRYIAD